MRIVAAVLIFGDCESSVSVLGPRCIFFHTYRYRLLLTDMFTVSNLWALVELCEARRSRDTGAEEGPSDSEAFRCILWYSVFKEHELE